MVVVILTGPLNVLHVQQKWCHPTHASNKTNLLPRNFKTRTRTVHNPLRVNCNLAPLKIYPAVYRSKRSSNKQKKSQYQSDKEVLGLMQSSYDFEDNDELISCAALSRLKKTFTWSDKHFS